MHLSSGIVTRNDRGTLFSGIEQVTPGWVSTGTGSRVSRTPASAAAQNVTLQAIKDLFSDLGGVAKSATLPTASGGDSHTIIASGNSGTVQAARGMTCVMSGVAAAQGMRSSA
jgi:hypothetical protein